MGTRRANGQGTMFKRNGVYYFKFTANGKCVTKSLGTRIKSEAEEKAKDYSAGHDMESRERTAFLAAKLAPPESNPTFDEAIERYHAHPRNLGQPKGASDEDDGVFATFRKWLFGQDIKGSTTNCKAAHPRAKRLNDITDEIAVEFIGAAVASPHTKNRYVRVLKRIWKFNKMAQNPWENFRKLKEDPKRRRAFTKDEVNRIISSSTGEMKTLFLFGAYTGQRMEDCAKMKWEMLSEDLSILMYKPHKTKDSSGVIVQIPLHRLIVAELKSIGVKKSGFITPELAELKKDALSDRVMAFFKDLGLTQSVETEGYRHKTPLVGYHGLRSTFISWCADAGLPLSFVQTLVGHVSPELTQLYYRSNAEHARAFIDKL